MRAWNSTLRPISKKRQAEIDSGTWKPKPRKALRQISKKSEKLWREARNKCINEQEKCFICGSVGILHCHHWMYTRTQRPDMKYDQSNLVMLCPKCHKHNGADKRFYELREIIKRKKGICDIF